MEAGDGGDGDDEGRGWSQGMEVMEAGNGGDGGRGWR